MHDMARLTVHTDDKSIQKPKNSFKKDNKSYLALKSTDICVFLIGGGAHPFAPSPLMKAAPYAICRNTCVTYHTGTCIIQRTRINV